MQSSRIRNLSPTLSHNALELIQQANSEIKKKQRTELKNNQSIKDELAIANQQIQALAIAAIDSDTQRDKLAAELVISNDLISELKKQLGLANNTIKVTTTQLSALQNIFTTTYGDGISLANKLSDLIAPGLKIQADLLAGSKRQPSLNDMTSYTHISFLSNISSGTLQSAGLLVYFLEQVCRKSRGDSTTSCEEEACCIASAIHSLLYFANRMYAPIPTYLLGFMVCCKTKSKIAVNWIAGVLPGGIGYQTLMNHSESMVRSYEGDSAVIPDGCTFTGLEDNNSATYIDRHGRGSSKSVKRNYIWTNRVLILSRRRSLTVELQYREDQNPLLFYFYRPRIAAPMHIYDFYSDLRRRPVDSLSNLDYLRSQNDSNTAVAYVAIQDEIINEQSAGLSLIQPLTTSTLEVVEEDLAETDDIQETVIAGVASLFDPASWLLGKEPPTNPKYCTICQRTATKHSRKCHYCETKLPPIAWFRKFFGNATNYWTFQTNLRHQGRKVEVFKGEYINGNFQKKEELPQYAHEPTILDSIQLAASDTIGFGLSSLHELLYECVYQPISSLFCNPGKVFKI